MAQLASAKHYEPLDLKRRLAFESRRLNAWWEGYAFDAAAERAMLSEEIKAERAALGAPI